MSNNTKNLLITVLIYSLLFCMIFPVFGDSTNTVSRKYETIMLQGLDIPALLNSNNSRLFLYKYNRATDTWEAIPFQIDETDNSDSYFGAKNGLLDNEDEILFMAQDLGDRADADQWISDPDARNARRFEIECTDPLTSDQGWIYIYLSNTLTKSATTYLDYIAAEDRIQSIYYDLKNGDSGLPQDLFIPVSAGGDGEEMLDRLKMMFRIKVTMLGNTDYITIREQINTNVTLFGFLSVHVHVWNTGAEISQEPTIRLNRNLKLGLEASASSLGMAFEDTLNFTTHYYPAYSEINTGKLNIPSISESGLTGTVDHIIISQDLNFNAVGMDFYSPNNQSGTIRVDAQPDAIDQSFSWPGSNWALIVADPTEPAAKIKTTSLVYLLQVSGSAPGNQQKLYYSDQVFSSPNVTGDLLTVGDTGVEITGTVQSENISLKNTSFYLPENLTYAQAANLVNETLRPITLTATAQVYSYPVTITIDPPGAGSVVLDPTEEFAVPDTQMTATAVESNPLYYFDQWSGDIVDTAKTIQFILNKPYNLTANFLPCRQITIDTRPTGHTFSIDGTQYNTTQTLLVKPGEIVNVSVDSVQQDEPGLRYRFTGWNSGDTLADIVYTAPDNNDTLLADMQAEYYLSLNISPESSGVTVPPPPGLWVKKDSLISVEAVQTGDDVFMSWAGSFSGTENPVSVLMDDPQSLTARFGNYPPVVTPSDTFFTEEDTLLLPLATIHNWVLDQNHADSLLTIQLNDGENIAVAWIDSIQTYQLTIPANWFGQDSLLLNAMDPKGSWDQAYVQMEVVNRPDTPESFALTAPEDQTLYTEWPESVDFEWEASTDNDPGDILTYTLKLDTTLLFNSPQLQSRALTATTYNFAWPDSFGNGAYYWHVTVSDSGGLTAASTDTFSLALATSMERTSQTDLPESYALHQNYPNPFNNETQIQYTLPQTAFVHIRIYNQQGQLVHVLENRIREAGYYNKSWNGRNNRGNEVASGVYFIELKTAEYRTVRKAMYLR